MSVDNTPVGIRALRQMRENRKPSERLTRKINQTYNYFLEHVDPIVGGCVTYLLSEQPSDIPKAMLEYLRARQANNFLVPGPGNDKPRRELKVFLATSIAPVLAGLVNRIAIVKPDDVMGFMTAEIEKYIANPSYFEEAGPVRTRPSTAGSKAHKGQANQANVIKEKGNKQEATVIEKNIQLAVIGLGGSGKSSILNMIQGKFDGRLRPTVGFRPVSMMLTEDTKIRFYDLGGGKKIRDIWTQYYHDAHGVVYVVDGTTTSDDMETTLQVFADSVNHPYLSGKPLLIFVNKQDQDGAMSPYDFGDLLRPLVKNPDTPIDIAGCSSLIPEEVPEGFEPDARLEASLMHLLNNVLTNFVRLNERVSADTIRKAAEDAEKRVAKERKVLKNKIASAFISEVNPAFIAEMGIEAEPENVFSEEEGLVYLASEIGVEVADMTSQAKEVAQMVGYQKLALTIIGGLKAPVSKKKVPMEWQELHDLVSTLRAELGLLPPSRLSAQ